MNATNYYVSTSRVVLQGDPEAAQTWQDLCRTLPILRNSLSCTVCESLLVEPYTPEDTDCEHHVCKGCKGGTKVMKPACSWCKDYSKYYENVQLRILIQNYKKLCGLIKITRLWGNIQKQGEQGKAIMDIVRESEGGKLRGNLRLAAESKVESSSCSSVKEEAEEELPVQDIKREPEVEPPDEIISSPVSKLSIYKTNPDVRHVENIKVRLLEDLTQLSPGVSPPHSAATSPSPTNVQKVQKGNRKIVKETFILNPFKGKSDLQQGPFKKLESNSKAESSLLRKYSLDLNSEKKILKEEIDLEPSPPPLKKPRLSVDNSSLPSAGTSVLVKQEPDARKAVPVAVVEAVEGEAAAAGPSTATSAAAAPGPGQLATSSPGSSSSSGSPAKTKAKKAGCRCGNATLCPGKLTCCGQRCPCYVDSLPCLDCKCKGCRNPHMPGGGKMRPVLPAIQNMKVFYPPTSKDQMQPVYSNTKSSSNSVIFQPVKSTPEKVVYKTMSAGGGDNKIVYPVRTFASRMKKEPGAVSSSVKLPVNTISIKDLDLSKLPIISLESISVPGAANKPVTRVVARSNSLQK